MAASSHEPQKSEREYQMGLAALEQGQYQESIEHLNVAAEANANDPEARFALANLIWERFLWVGHLIFEQGHQALTESEISCPDGVLPMPDQRLC